jgi:hypothetical protein
VPDALAQAVLAEKEHRDVGIQVILLDINEVSSVSESFEANVPYLLTWQEPYFESFTGDLQQLPVRIKPAGTR